MTDLDKLNLLTLINLALDHLEAAEGTGSRYRLQEAARLLGIASDAAEKLANTETEENGIGDQISGSDPEQD